MYDLVDRPVTSLNRGGQLLVAAMRHWVKAVSATRCPCGDVGAMLDSAELLACLPHFNMLMVSLNRHALGKVCFGAPDCARTSEDEAILLSLIGSAHRIHPEQLRDCVAMIVGEDAIGQMSVALTVLAQTLAGADLVPGVAGAGRDRADFCDE